ncbi:GntR family transcriptional regulator [Martelella radicis]|uniref:DNA-binding GntR family transcriptional regulator n=1 Tax=Martelella radicis TaxID=1397476 RepID=A0A7W6KL77_9HYPH|nr:GntR family transcriptional regulator [Martelella radicis]MBB4123348.1 DNA-binding GntR family transcriptional regulator [Martelella radicis]
MLDDNQDPPETSLAEEAYRALLAEIVSARLAGGTVIQQRRLATEHSVSRSPMRHAISRLEGEGLLVRTGKGLLAVRVVTLKEYLDSLAMRMLLEPSAAYQACGNINADALAALSEELDAIDRARDPDPEDVWHFDDGLHLTIARQCGNGFMEATIADMRRYTTIFERQAKSVRSKPGVAEHRAILDALAAAEPEGTRQAMVRHLEMVREGVLRNY